MSPFSGAKTNQKIHPDWGKSTALLRDPVSATDTPGHKRPLDGTSLLFLSSGDHAERVSLLLPSFLTSNLTS